MSQLLCSLISRQDAQYLEAVPGWDSGVGSDCFPGLEMDSGEVIGGEFGSEGSGALASEEREQSECTCDDRHQPDNVKVRDPDTVTWSSLSSPSPGHHRTAEGPCRLLRQAADRPEAEGAPDTEAALLPRGRLGLGHPQRDLHGPHPHPRLSDCPRLHHHQPREAQLCL